MLIKLLKIPKAVEHEDWLVRLSSTSIVYLPEFDSSLPANDVPATTVGFSLCGGGTESVGADGSQHAPRELCRVSGAEGRRRWIHFE